MQTSGDDGRNRVDRRESRKIACPPPGRVNGLAFEFRGTSIRDIWFRYHAAPVYWAKYAAFIFSLGFADQSRRSVSQGYATDEVRRRMQLFRHRRLVLAGNRRTSVACRVGIVGRSIRAARNSRGTYDSRSSCRAACWNSRSWRTRRSRRWRARSTPPATIYGGIFVSRAIFFFPLLTFLSLCWVPVAVTRRHWRLLDYLQIFRILHVTSIIK